MSAWLLIVAASYLLGSIPTGYWLGKAWKGIDVREHGSGNLGATNVFRVLGTGPGLITLALDILKGALPVLGVKHVDPQASAWAAAAGLAAILGHMTSVFVHFRGGKGVATSAGVFAALLPVPSVIALAAFLLCLAGTRMVSASSICGTLALAASALVLSPAPFLAYAAAVAACLVIWKHRGNIRRILAGTESKIGFRRTL